MSDASNTVETAEKEIKPKKPKKQKKVRGEGRRLRSLPFMTLITPFVMKTRNDALNYVSGSIDIDETEEYIAKKKAEGYRNFNLMHIFLAAYVRTIAEKPGVNRFIRGQRIYARNGIEICLTIKKEMEPNSPDTVVKFFPRADSTAVDIYNEVDRTISASKADSQTSLDRLMKNIVWFPAFIFRGFIGAIKLLDYYRLLPRALTRISPFHASYFITSMGSLGIPPIYHHLYNLGNVPLFTSFGAKYRETYLKPDGTVATRRKVDYKIVMDERICDGFYYASALKTMLFYIRHPAKLDAPPAAVVEDVD